MKNSEFTPESHDGNGRRLPFQLGDGNCSVSVKLRGCTFFDGKEASGEKTTRDVEMHHKFIGMN